MKHALLIPALLLAVSLAVSGCLESTEDITVREDGSVEVVVTAKSDRADDLTDGYPVPLHEPWQPVGETAIAWVRHVARDTGSELARQKLASLATGTLELRDRPLSARATFDSVADLPQWYAPVDEPYRSAFLERTAELDIERRGDRTVYTFDRVYHRRAHKESVWTLVARGIPDDIEDKLDDGGDLTEFEWNKIAKSARDAFRDLAYEIVRDSLVGVYLRGDASLSVDAHRRVLVRVGEATSDFVSIPRLKELLQETVAWDEAEKRDEHPGDVHPLVAFPLQVREILRESLTTALADEEIRAGVRHGILERLEWNFTAIDHNDDLGDESFTVRIALPGTIVGGNWKYLDDKGRAVFEFDGNVLMTGDARMRAVSVVE